MTDTTTTTTESTTTETTEPKKIEFSPEQSEWISKKIAAELKSDREKRDAAAADEKRKADEARQRDEATKRGEFDKVKADLDQAIAAKDAQIESLTAELTTLREQAERDYKAAVAKLPEDYRAMAPNDDEPITERQTWLAKASQLAEKRIADTPRGNGGNPPPSGGGQGPIESPVPKSKLM